MNIQEWTTGVTGSAIHIYSCMQLLITKAIIHNLLASILGQWIVEFSKKELYKTKIQHNMDW